MSEDEKVAIVVSILGLVFVAALYFILKYV